MAHSDSVSTTSALTEEAFMADRQAFWASFNTASVAGIVFMVLLLIAMWVFLV